MNKKKLQNDYKMLLQAKPVKGFEHLYLITPDGRVFSLRKYCFMKTWKNDKGYLNLYLKDEFGKKHIKKIHRLVAEHHIPNPEMLPQVNHKDENKCNNTMENLEWCTNKYNSNYGTRGMRIGQANKGRGTKAINMVDDYGNVIKRYSSETEAETDGFVQSNISSSIKRGGRTNGCKFVYAEE